MEKAIIVGLDIQNSYYDINYSLDELTNLALSNDIIVVDLITQKAKKPSPTYYVGKGKVDEIKLAITHYDVDMVIFDDELSPSQLRNLEAKLEIKIIDRSFLILDIFAKRAKTNEAILEIKLAQNKYLLPRLTGLHKDLSRQGGTTGGFSAKGPGEKQLELDKRLLANEINRLERQLKDIKAMKETQASKRKDPVVALVGYTNAGKSSTMNTIIDYTLGNIDKQVYEHNSLFATLSTHLRAINYNYCKFILIDTIGFVSKLPHHLVNSFRSTLEEIKQADLIVHVVDISSRYYEQQISVTNNVLANLNCSNIPMVYLLNKYDLLENEDLIFTGADNIPFSNKTKLNIDTLLNYIVKSIQSELIPLELLVPYKDGNIANFLEENSKVEAKMFLDNGIFYKIEINKKHYNKVSLYQIKENIS